MSEQHVPLRVLLVEDSESDALLVLRALRRAGYAVTHQRVMTAPEMQAALAGPAWDLVISDYSLPHFDALRGLEVLRQSALDLPFVIVSGTITEESAVTALRAGAHDFVTKGNLARLGPAVERELRQAADRQRRREAEAGLRAQEQRFRALIENNTDAIMLVDQNGLVVYDTPAAARLLGYSPGAFVGQDAFGLVHPDDQPPTRALLQQLLQGTAPAIPVQMRLLHSDGSWHWIEGVATNMLADPSVQAVVFNYRDITQRRQAEEQLRFQAHLLNTVDQAVIATSLEGSVTYWNRFAQTLFGWSAQEMLGQNARELVTGSADAPQAADLIERLRQGASWRGELVLRRRDGTQFPAQTTATPVYSEQGQLIGLISTSVDITERRRAEEALVHSERRFRALIENSGDAITLLDSTGSVIFDSPAAPRLMGYGADEFIGQSAFSLIHPEDQAPMQAQLAQLLACPTVPVKLQLRLKHKDGAWRWIEGVATNLLAEPAVQAVVVNYRDITERKTAETEIRRQLDRLAALRAIDLAITSSLDLRLTLTVFLEQVISQLGVHAADILLLDAAEHTLAYTAGRGFRTSGAQHAPVHLGEGRAGRAALERRIVSEITPDPLRAPARRTGLLGQENFTSYYGVPLLAKGQVLGVLELFHREPLRPAPEWLEFLEALAGQAAIAIENATLFDGLQRTHQDLVLAYDATIEGWSRALDLRDKETEGHSQRVTDLTLRLARAMGMPDTDLVQVRRGALLHDMGKIGIPDHILLKPGPLSDDEWVTMRQHPTFAYELLSPITFLQPALDIPYCHHEKWDGSGYPRGLRGEQIPLAARLFAVVDVWDALRSNRPYRPAWPTDRVLAHLRALAGSHFDPRAVEMFLQLLSERQPKEEDPPAV